MLCRLLNRYYTRRLDRLGQLGRPTSTTLAERAEAAERGNLWGVLRTDCSATAPWAVVDREGNEIRVGRYVRRHDWLEPALVVDIDLDRKVVLIRYQGLQVRVPCRRRRTPWPSYRCPDLLTQPASTKGDDQ